MSLKLSKMYVLSLYVALFGQACMFIGLPLQTDLLTTLGTYSIAGAALLSLFIWFVNNDGDGWGKLLFAVLTAFTVIAILFSGKLSYSTFVKVMTFLELPIFVLTADKIKSKAAKNIVYAFNMVYPVIFGALLASPISHRYFSEYGVVFHENITLGYGNPNETSIYLMVNFIILFAGVFKFKAWYVKLLCLAEATFIGYLVFLSGCRATIIVVVSIALLSVVFKRIRLYRPILWIVFAVPVFFFFALRWFPDLIVMGDVFDTGRSEMYRVVFDQLDLGKIILGDFDTFALNNLHNALLSVFASLGSVCVLIFTIILFLQTKSLGKTVAIKERKVLLIGVLALVVHSSVEAALLVSGTAYAASFFTIYYLCVDDSEAIEDITNESVAH